MVSMKLLSANSVMMQSAKELIGIRGNDDVILVSLCRVHIKWLKGTSL